jgi:hypothetical protein
MGAFPMKYTGYLRPNVLTKARSQVSLHNKDYGWGSTLRKVDYTELANKERSWGTCVTQAS